MTNVQKKAISKFSRQVCELRDITTNLTAALDVNEETKITNVIKQKINILTQCFIHTMINLEQFREILKSCPENGISDMFEPAFDAELSNSRIVTCYKDSEDWNKLYTKVKSILAIVKKHKTALQKVNNLVPNILGKRVKLISISQAHIDVTTDAYNNLKLINKDINDLLLNYQFKFKNSVIDNYIPEHPLLQNIVALSTYLNNTIKKVDNLYKNIKSNEENNKDTINNFTKETEDLIASMLLTIQSIYKIHLPKEQEENDVLDAIDEMIDDNVEHKEPSTEVYQEILEENHLKELLQEKLLRDIKLLQIDSLIEKTKILHNRFVHKLQSSDDVEALKNIIMRAIPILEQFTLFVQYFLIQQVSLHRVSCKMFSILLKIFIDLSTKG